MNRKSTKSICMKHKSFSVFEHVFNVTFNKLNASLLNKSILFFLFLEKNLSVL